jgi:hypothetical protein
MKTDTATLKRLLRKAAKHCPPGLSKQIDDALGPQPDETLSREILIACMADAVDGRDIGDALHYASRIQNLDQ